MVADGARGPPLSSLDPNPRAEEMFSLAKGLDTTMAPVTSPTVLAASPQALADGLRLSVTRLARQMRQQSDTGMTPTQLAALATIERSGPMPIGALAEVEQIGAPTATKIVDKLEAAGHVARVPDPDDRRVTRVQITDDGHRFLRELRARKTAWLSTRLGALGPDDLAALEAAAAVLERLAAPPTPPPEAQR